MTDVRRLDLADRALVAELIALQRAAYAAEAELIGSDAIPALRETPGALRAAGLSFLGAFDGGALVGAVAWKAEGATVDVHRLVVSPRALRRGIASALLDALEAAQPAERWLVSTAAANAPALALYERRGFRRRGEAQVAPGLRIVRLERGARE